MSALVTDKQYPLASEDEENQQPAKQRSASTLAFNLAARPVLYFNINKLLHLSVSQTSGISISQQQAEMSLGF